MALPDVMLPSPLGDFKADSYVFSSEPMYAGVPRQTGPLRKRRVFTTAPRVLDAELETTQAGIEAFFLWHENVLKAGSLPFAAKLAKVGSGVEYWEARILAFTVEHKDGANQHVIGLKLRLFGDPSDTPPAGSPLAVEFGAALNAYLDTPAYMLSAEFGAALEASADVGALLSCEMVAHLYTEANGAEPTNRLDVEFVIALEVFSGDLPGADLSAEFAAALEALAYVNNDLSMEISAALTLTQDLTVGYVAAPANITVSGILPGAAGYTATARVRTVRSTSRPIRGRTRHRLPGTRQRRPQVSVQACGSAPCWSAVRPQVVQRWAPLRV